MSFANEFCERALVVVVAAAVVRNAYSMRYSHIDTILNGNLIDFITIGKCNHNQPNKYTHTHSHTLEREKWDVCVREREQEQRRRNHNEFRSIFVSLSN